MGNDGSAAIVTGVWDAYGKVYINEYRNGSWVYPTAADFLNLGGYTANDWDIAMDNSGNTIVVWTQRKDATTVRYLYKSEYRGGGWTHPALLTDEFSPDDESVDHPKVAMDDNGNAIIVRTQIFMSEYRSGTWNHPVSLLDNISPDLTAAQDPQVAMSNNGEAMIVWEQDNGSGDDHIYRSHYQNGVWLHPTNLTEPISPAGDNCSVPQVAMDDEGNAIIVWRQFLSGDFHVFISEYRNDVWIHPADTSDHISLDLSSASDPQVAMDDHGNAVVTWYEGIGAGDDKIFMSEFR